VLSERNDSHHAWHDDRVPSGIPPSSTKATRDLVVDLDISWLVPADIETVDALARLQVAASRSGCWLQLHGAQGGLVELLELVGLGDVVHRCSCCDLSNGTARDEWGGWTDGADPPPI
jgi:hypothetical protein